MDELRRIPKLTTDMQKDLIKLRHVHPQGIRDWMEVRKVRGVGPNVMVQILIFCKDPATTPLPAVQPDDSGLYPGDTLELPEMPAEGSSSGTDPELPGLVFSSSSNASTSGSSTSHPTGVILHTVAVTPGQQTNKWHEVFLAAGSDEKPGQVMLDSGCFRCVAGKRTHTKMRDYLRQYGLNPLEINRVEEFVFGNCDTELSDKKLYVPRVP